MVARLSVISLKLLIFWSLSARLRKMKLSYTKLVTVIFHHFFRLPLSMVEWRISEFSLRWHHHFSTKFISVPILRVFPPLSILASIAEENYHQDSRFLLKNTPTQDMTLATVLFCKWTIDKGWVFCFVCGNNAIILFVAPRPGCIRDATCGGQHASIVSGWKGFWVLLRPFLNFRIAECSSPSLAGVEESNPVAGLEPASSFISRPSPPHPSPHKGSIGSASRRSFCRRLDPTE